MKRNKKILSVLAGLALSGAMVIGATGLAACSGNKVEVEPEGKIAISTAIGTSYTSTSGKVYYVSPTATSNTVGEEGNIEKPYGLSMLLASTDSVQSPLQPGDTVYILPGVYELQSTITTRIMGTYDKYIRILNAGLCKGEGFEDNAYTGTDKRVVLSFYGQDFASTERGIQLYGNYTYWYGIDVAGAGDNGFYIGGSYNTVEYGEFYDNRDSGLQLGRQESGHNTMDLWPSFNLVKNCTSHNNYDNQTFGENADGFAAKLTIGFGNVFDGCVAYRNSDDGWDLYAKVDSGNIGAVIIYNCVAFENGFLEYDRDTSNARYDKFAQVNAEGSYTDGTENKYLTRDGDGNGFKLGGSVMEGDVVMYNCLSFQNRMHGVTDNSNPGYLKVEGVTSYDNSAKVNPTTGKVECIAAEKVGDQSEDSHGNIDVARQTYSYNTVKGVLSVHSAIPTTLANDAYRGSVFNSLLNAGGKTNVINGVMEADTNATGNDFTSQIDALVATDVFEQLPVDMTDAEGVKSYTYHIQGAGNSGERATTDATTKNTLGETRVHVAWRNAADNSLNLGNLLAMKSTFDPKTNLTGLAEGEIFGSTLNKSSWEDYTHFVNEDLFAGVTSADAATAEKVKETLTINTEESGVYQDFEIPTELQSGKITWSSDDEEHLQIGEDVETSVSGSKYIKAIIYRDALEDKEVTLTATITVGTATVTKDFPLVIKQGNPSVGQVRVVDEFGRRYTSGAQIADQYDVYTEPEVEVLNGLYPDAEKVLSEELYDLETTYKYAASTTDSPVEIKGFTASVAGVYTITHKVTLKTELGFPASSQTMTYQLYVASPVAVVDFDGESSVVVNRHGFSVDGKLSNATGYIYAVTSATEKTDITLENIKTYEGVQAQEFRAVAKTFQFDAANAGEYFIYYALGNSDGSVTSKQVYTAHVTTQEISTTADFIKIAGGDKIGEENPATTIYQLTEDLDFTGVDFSSRGTKNFEGMLDGMGHKISNITITSTGGKNIGVFYRLAGGTIQNIKFEDISITANGERVGLITESKGGYIYNLSFKNYGITNENQRTGGLVGYVMGENSENVVTTPLEISQVSIINDADHVMRGGTGACRMGGLLGYIQYYRNAITIDNCQVVSNFVAGPKNGDGSENGGTGSEVGGLVGSWEDQKQDSLTITNCFFKGTVRVGSSARGAGILAYHKNGAGVLRISQCISIIDLWQSNGRLGASIKNGSPILGNYSANADVQVTKCVGTMEEHNTNYDSSLYSEDLIASTPALFSGEGEMGILNFDFTKWDYKYAEGSTTQLAAPYVTLKFLA